MKPPQPTLQELPIPAGALGDMGSVEVLRAHFATHAPTLSGDAAYAEELVLVRAQAMFAVAEVAASVLSNGMTAVKSSPHSASSCSLRGSCVSLGRLRKRASAR